MIIGSRIKEARIKLGLTQEQLGNLIGVSKVAICGYEQGTRTPTIRALLKLADILNLDIDFIFGHDVSAVAEDNNLTVKIRREDLKLLSELKKSKQLYTSLIDNPERTIKLIDKKLYK